MNLTRRGFIRLASGLLLPIAPAIVRAESLMKCVQHPPSRHEVYEDILINIMKQILEHNETLLHTPVPQFVKILSQRYQGALESPPQRELPAIRIAG